MILAVVKQPVTVSAVMLPKKYTDGVLMLRVLRLSERRNMTIAERISEVMESSGSLRVISFKSK